jgi:probable F420-dependent oxidoreductase
VKFSNAILGVHTDDYVPVAQAAEAAGFESIALSDHIFYPEKLATPYPYTADGTPQFSPDESWPDPWVTTGLLSGATSRLKFMTNVYVLPLRNPFVTAKAAGTAAFLSKNRVILGVGAGWMREEFQQMEQDYEKRGRRTEELITVVRTLLQGGMVEHHGEFYDFDRLAMAPVPTEPLPIYVGGTSKYALRRAARFGDGWIGMYHTVDELKEICAGLQREREAAGRGDEPFDVVASPKVIPRPDTVAELERAGVTTILTSAWIAKGLKEVSGNQAIDLLGEFGERFIAPLALR